MRNRDIEAGAKAIADDLMLPGGRRKKLSRVIEEHLAWFDAAEARGMTWDDMIVALAAVGVTGGNGRPLSIGTLSSAVWRKRYQVSNGSPSRGNRSAEAQRVTPAKKPPSRQHGSDRSTGEEGFRQVARSPRRSANSGQRLKETASPSTAVLAFMQRAAKMRRRADDD